MARELTYRPYLEILHSHLWYSTISPGSEVQPITVKTHTSSSLSVVTRYVRPLGVRILGSWDIPRLGYTADG
jgi:hypothetical protein